MSKKLLAKASLIQLPPVVPPPAETRAAPPEAAQPPADAGARPEREGREGRVKTAPGSMAHFMASQSTAMKEAEDLRERLRAFDGAQPVRALDPQTVKPSRWANRHEHSFRDAAFDALKAEIASAGGNVQPASVRRLPEAGQGGYAYELIYGHRRHRACLELGLPLKAMVVEATDQQLFEAMERENRARKNLSAWEQGTMYRRALDEGLYPSQRKLAESLGVDVSLVSKSLSLARLPETVVAAFPSPLDIQFRWAQPLAEALQRDPDALVARATKLKGQGGSVPAARVFAVLIGAEPLESPARVLNGSTTRATRRVVGQGGRTATLMRDASGRVNVQFSAGALDGVADAELVAWLEQLLAVRPASQR